MTRQYQRIFNLPSGKFKLVIDFDASNDLSFEALNISTLEFGYEDEDLLTAYPNVIHLEFVDPNAISYLLLNEAFNLSPGIISTPPYTNYNEKHGLTLYQIFPDNSYNIIFQGYIDKQSLRFDSDSIITSFDAISSLSILKDLRLSSSEYSNYWYYPLIGFGSVNFWEPEHILGESMLYFIFRKIFPNMPTVVYNISPGQSPSVPGFHFFHNWNFLANGRVGVPEIYKNFPNDYADIYYCFFPLIESSNTYGELLKKIAFEFGLSIGSTAQNSVFAIRRFSTISGLNSTSIINNVISYSREPFLKNISGVKTTYAYDNTMIYTQGHVPTAPDGSPANTDIILDLSTRYGTNFLYTSQSPITKLYDPSQNIYNVCLNGIYDPALDYAYRYPIDILTRWTYQSRKSVKEKFEFELLGTDYDICKYYNFSDNCPTVYLRPIKIIKNLIANTTKLIALTYNT